MASTRRPRDAIAATPSGRIARDVARSARTTDGARRRPHGAQDLNYGSYLLHDVYSAATSRVKIHCVWW